MEDKEDYRREKGDLLEEISSWRDEAQSQISDIIDYHSSNINKGIHILEKEVGDLQAELSVIREQRSTLLKIVENLNGEIRHLRAMLPITQPSSEQGDSLNHDIIHEETAKEAVLDAPEQNKEKTGLHSEEVKDECLDYIDSSHQITDLRGMLPITQPSSEQEDNTSHDIIHEEIAEEVVLDATEESTEKTRLPSEKVKDECLDYSDSSHQNYQQQQVTSQVITSEDFVCSDCNFSFPTIESLTLHSCPRELHGNKKDNERFGNNHGNEKQISHKKRERTFKCEKCPYASSSKRHMKSHINEVHDKIKGFACSECSYIASQKHTLAGHMVSVHKLGDKKFSCDKCPYASSHKSHMKSHIDEVHEKIRRYACGECSYTALRKRSLPMHMLSVHKMGEKKFSCDKCSFASLTNNELKIHTKGVHDKIRDHICGECDFATSQSCLLKVHVESVHERKTNHICKDCGYATYHKASLKKHIEHRHKVG